MENEYTEKDKISIIVFEVGWEQFAIELLEVKEIIQAGQIRRLPKGFDFIEGIFNYRGDIIHVINLKKKLRLDDYNLYGFDNNGSNKNTSNNTTSEKNAPEKNAPEKNDSDIESNENSHVKFIIVANINDTNIGFYVDRVQNVVHVNVKDIIRLSPIFQTSISVVDYIKGIIKFEDKPRILINLNKILSETEQTTIKKEKVNVS